MGGEEALPLVVEGKEIDRTSGENEVAFGGVVEELTEVAFHLGK